MRILSTLLLLGWSLVQLAFLSLPAQAQSNVACPNNRTVGTDEHMVRCLTETFKTSPEPKTPNGLPLFSSCLEHYARYARAIGGNVNLQVNCGELASKLHALNNNRSPLWTSCTVYSQAKATSDNFPIYQCFTQRLFKRDADNNYLSKSEKAKILPSSGELTCDGLTSWYREKVELNSDGVTPTTALARQLTDELRGKGVRFSAQSAFVAPPCDYYKQFIKSYEEEFHPFTAALKSMGSDLSKAAPMILSFVLLGLLGAGLLVAPIIALRRDWKVAKELAGTKVELSERAATVVAEKVWSETHVRGGSSGGGGWTGPHGGYVSAPSVTINSAVKTNYQIVLQFDDGSQRSLLYQDDNSFGAYTGSRIRVISIGANGKSNIVKIINPATNRWLRYDNVLREFALQTVPVRTKSLMMHAAVVVIALGLLLIAGPIALAVVAIGAAVLAARLYFVYQMHIRAIEKRLGLKFQSAAA